MQSEKALSIYPTSEPITGKSPKIGSFLRISLLSGFFVLIGAGMQGYACGTAHAMFVAILFFVIGGAVAFTLFAGYIAEMRVFLVAYGVCLLVGGGAQCYSLDVFNDPQSTIDSFTFLQHISPHPPFMTMANMPLFNSPLAVVIWQQVYKLAWWLDLDFGPYIGVMFNALVVGLTGSLTVKTARELFGDDGWRLRRVGTLFALCGLFIMFGAVLLRDCYTTFLNALVLWVLVRYLVTPTWRSLLLAVLFTSFSAYAMAYLRLQAVVLFGVYALLAVLFRFVSKGMNWARLFSAGLAICVVFFTSTYLLSYLEMFEEIQSRGVKGYSELSSRSSSDDSLGMRFIVNQPLPVRLVFGSGAMMINPIPLWANFDTRLYDSHWIKGYHGVYQVLIMPLVFAGFLISIRCFRQDRERALALLFLIVYLVVNMMAVVATSMEQRHLAQFMPAFMILAAVPDTRDKSTLRTLQKIRIGWYSSVFFVHLAWVLMKV